MELLFNRIEVIKKDGWKAIIKFSIIILNEIKETLIGIDLDTLSGFLKEHLNCSLNVNNALLEYKKLKISNKQLSSLREEYFLSLAKEKVEVNDLLNRQKTE